MIVLTKALKNQLVSRCLQRTKTFGKLGDTLQTKHGPLTWIDNGGSVLAVAHLDWVMKRDPYLVDNTIYCPQLDDRLGVWTILDLLPKLGVKVDVLLTDSEESGQSTSQYFISPKNYNWMFQFDRRGTDVVLYQYDSDENGARLEKYGFEVGCGTFSDICSLDNLGISGWNVGVGYHHEHSAQCYANLDDTYANAVKFANFWADWKDTLIPAPAEEDRTERRWWGSSINSYAGIFQDSLSNRVETRSIYLDPSVEEDYYCWQCQCGAIWFVTEEICDNCAGDIDDAVWNEELGWEDILEDEYEQEDEDEEDDETDFVYDLDIAPWRLPE